LRAFISLMPVDVYFWTPLGEIIRKNIFFTVSKNVQNPALGNRSDVLCSTNRMSKAQKNSRRVPEEKAATSEEIEEAFNALSDVELVKLKKFAAFRIRGIGRAALGRNGGDLLQEAFISLVTGDRRWNKEKVNMFGFLHGAVESISSHWGEKSDPDAPTPDEAKLESEFIRKVRQGITSLAKLPGQVIRSSPLKS
jgi:hypothetical protein